MRTKHHNPKKYVYPKNKQYITEYEVIEAESVRELKTAVVAKLNEGFELEGGMVVYKVDKWDKIWEKVKETQVFSQTMAHYVVAKKEEKPEPEKPKTVVKGLEEVDAA